MRPWALAWHSYAGLTVPKTVEIQGSGVIKFLCLGHRSIWGMFISSSNLPPNWTRQASVLPFLTSLRREGDGGRFLSMSPRRFETQKLKEWRRMDG